MTAAPQPVERRRPRSGADRRRAVFLDRDGVLNRAILNERGLPLPPRSRDEFELIASAPDACARLKQAGFLLICVTNQPDIARGTADLGFVHWVNDAVAAACQLDEVRVCAHDDADGCACRKPKPGMIVAAAETHNIDLVASFMVGDRFRDIDAGHAAGCRTIMIDEHYPERAPARPPAASVCHVGEAADFILSE